MEKETRLRKIGTEKRKSFDKDFDGLYDFYKNKAEDMGYFGELKFIKERGKVLIYTIIDMPDIESNFLSDLDLED
jgi:hypothetical protein